MEIAASRGVPNNKNAQKDTKIRANQKTQDHIEIKGKFWEIFYFFLWESWIAYTIKHSQKIKSFIISSRFYSNILYILS